MSENTNVIEETNETQEDAVVNVDDEITKIDIIVEMGRHYAAQLYAARFAANSEMYGWHNPWEHVRLHGKPSVVSYPTFLHGITNQLIRSADKLKAATDGQVIVPINVQDAIAKAAGFVEEYNRCMEYIDRKWKNDPVKVMEDRLKWGKNGENPDENV